MQQYSELTNVHSKLTIVHFKLTIMHSLFLQFVIFLQRKNILLIKKVLIMYTRKTQTVMRSFRTALNPLKNLTALLLLIGLVNV